MPAVAALDALSTISSRAAAGDREAFRHFVERTNGTVFRVVMRMLGDSAEAQDVVQETYVRAWHGLSTLRDHNAALGWLCRIARNVATDGLRSRMSRPTQSMETLSVSDAALDVFTSQLPGPEHAASSKETRGFVMAAVASLLGGRGVLRTGELRGEHVQRGV